MTPLGAVLRGALAAGLGTLAMDAVWYRRYRRGGGSSRFRDWELASGLSSWDEAPVPAKAGKRVYEGFFQRQLPASAAQLTTNVMHWVYPSTWGAIFGIVAGSRSHLSAGAGIPLGAVVFLNGYVVLPLAGLYKPIWEYDLKTIYEDLSAHLVFGTTTGVAFKLLSLVP
jgi:hypothetical protein